MNPYVNPYVTCLFALASCAGVASAGDVPSATPEGPVAELTQLVHDLQDQVRQLRAEQGEDWLTERRAEEIRSLVQDVLADADTRASLLQSGATAGYDKHFFIASADGGFRLNLEGQLQVRYVYNHQDDGTAASPNTSDQDRAGFEIRRSKLVFVGHVLDPTWAFKVQGAFARGGGEFEVEDAFIAKDFGNGLELKVGQFKPPFLREELVSSKRQLAVDRSLLNERFNQDRSIGIQVDYEGERFRGWTMVNNGMGKAPGFDVANNRLDPDITRFSGKRRSFDTEDTEFAVAARGEILLAGDWKQFKDFTSRPGSAIGFMLGGAILYQRAEFGTSSTDELDDLRATVDASLEGDGWNAFAAFVWADFNNHTPASAANHIDSTPWGVLVQGGVFLADDWEVFARYEYGDDDDFPSRSDTLSVVTVGVNRYWNRHGLKWTTDFGYAFDPVTDAFDATGVGYRPDVRDDGQFVIRSQLQVLF